MYLRLISNWTTKNLNGVEKAASNQRNLETHNRKAYLVEGIVSTGTNPYYPIVALGTREKH